MRWRIAAGVAGVLVVGLVAVGLWARLFAGGPVGLIPGGTLDGEVVREPVDDWSFAASRQYLDVESRARWVPYSVRAWFMVDGGQLYVLLPRLFGDGLERRLDEDPEARIRLDGRVYPVRAVRHDGEEELGVLLAPAIRRTMAVEIGGDVRRVAGAPPLAGAGMAVFRIESAP